MKTILVVDDSSEYLLAARAMLESEYKVRTAHTSAEMFDMLDDGALIPDLFVLDIEMPGMSGFDIIGVLKSEERFKNVPVMFASGWTEDAIMTHAFELGATDFVTKPFNKRLLCKRVESCLSVGAFVTAQKRNNPNDNVYNNSLSIFAEIAEGRDNATTGHIDRVAAYLRIFLTTLKHGKLYPNEIGLIDTETAVSASRLHDIGKIALPDYILTKAARLTHAERVIMQSHVIEGEAIIDKLAALGGNDVFLQCARIAAGTHHERWDGTGYPRGLKTTQTPLLGRVMAIVDVYDAMVTPRPYKLTISHGDAVRIIMKEKGTQFDPLLLDIFYDICNSFKHIVENKE